MSTPEIKQPEQQPVVEHQTDFDPTPQMVEQGIVSTPSQAQQTTVQISDAQQVQITPVPAPSNVQSITLPADPTVLTQQSKGSTDDSSTWFAVYWLRIMKKAVKKGFQVLVGEAQ
jgi:hypothetical protein